MESNGSNPSGEISVEMSRRLQRYNAMRIAAVLLSVPVVIGLLVVVGANASDRELLPYLLVAESMVFAGLCFSSGWISANGSAMCADNVGDRPVRVIVCQWSRTRPVLRTKG